MNDVRNCISSKVLLAVVVMCGAFITTAVGAQEPQITHPESGKEYSKGSNITVNGVAVSQEVVASLAIHLYPVIDNVRQTPSTQTASASSTGSGTWNSVLTYNGWEVGDYDIVLYQGGQERDERRVHVVASGGGGGPGTGPTGPD